MYFYLERVGVDAGEELLVEGGLNLGHGLLVAGRGVVEDLL